MNQNPFTLDHLLNIQRVTCRVPLHLSPDGRWLTVSVQKQMGVAKVATDDDGFTLDGVPDEALGSRVLVVETSTGEVIEPFPFGSTSWAGQWSPDSKQLVAYVQHEGFACLGLWDVEQRTVRMLREAEVRPAFGFEVPQWTPDSTAVVAKLRKVGHEPWRRMRKTRESDPPIIVQSFDPATSLDAGEIIGSTLVTMLGDLARIDVDTNEVQRLGIGWHFRGWRVAPDNHAVAVLCATDINLLGTRPCFDLLIVPFDGTAPRTVASRVPMWWATTFAWSPDSRYLSYTSHDWEGPSHLFVVPADGSEEPRRLSSDTGVRADEYAGPCWSGDSQFVYCPYRGSVWEYSPDGSHSRQITAKFKENGKDQTGQSRVFRVLQRPLHPAITLLPDGSLPCLLENSVTKRESLGRIRLSDGETEILTEWERIDPDGGFSFEATADGSVCYLVREASDRPPEIWSVRHDEECQSQRLMAFNPALDDVALCSTRLIDWRDADGEVRRAILALPCDYQEGQRLPMIVSIYGGFEYSDEYLHRFGIDDVPYTNAHWLTSHGYAVLYPDMPMKDSDPYRQMPALVLPAVNRAIDLGIADPHRLGLTGFSYGGYCVMSVVTQTTRFRAAISDGGAGFNMTSQYGLEPSWCEGKDQARLNGTPWDKRDAYIENSPLFYMDRVCTPVLLIAGSDDEANAANTQEVFNALRRLGQRVELRIYKGEGHGTQGWSESNVRDVCARVLSWFDEHLKAQG